MDDLNMLKGDEDERTEVGQFALHYAACMGDVDTMRMQLKGNTNERDNFNRTLLHCAALGGDLDIFNLLPRTQATVNAKDLFDRTPLHYAALGGNLDIVNLLLAEDADFLAADKGGATPIHYAALGHNLQSLNLLKTKRFTSCPEDKVSPLQFLAFKGNTHLTTGEPISYHDSKGGNRIGPLHGWRGNFDVFTLLLEKAVGVNFPDKNGAGLLHYAAYGGNSEVFKLLVDQETDANIEDHWKRTPLHYAALGGNLHITHLLLNRGVTTQAQDKNGATPVHCAAYGGDPAVIELLLSKRANDLNEKDKFCRSLLHYAALGGNVDAVDLLVDNGAEVHQPDGENGTPLHYAAMGGNVDIVNLLINKGADAGETDTYGRLPLHYAAEGGNSDVFDQLLPKVPIADITRSTLTSILRKSVQDKRSDTILVDKMICKLKETRKIQSDQRSQADDQSEKSPTVEQPPTNEEPPTDDQPPTNEQPPTDVSEMASLATIDTEEGVAYEVAEGDHPLLMDRFKDEVEKGLLHILRTTIYVANFDLEETKAPLKVTVSVKSILEEMGEQHCDEDGFFLLCKLKDELTDITNTSQLQLHGDRLVFSCHHFNDLIVGWSAVKRYVEQIREFWSETFRAKLCPVFTREQHGYLVDLFCHTPSTPVQQGEHTCDEHYPVDVSAESVIKFQLTWFTAEGEASKWSSEHRVDREVWRATGTCVSERAAVVGSSVTLKAFTIQDGREVCVRSWNKTLTEPLETYPRTGRGLVVIINNINFSSDKKLKRTGSELDEENVKRLFEHTIRGQYDVLSGVGYRDCTSEGIRQKLREVQNKLKEKRYNQLLLFMFSHGDERGLLTYEKNYIRQEDIIAHFGGDRVKEMMDLPKVFVFQACRGHEVNVPVVSVDNPHDIQSVKIGEECKNHVAIICPRDAHMVTAYATTPGHYAYRNTGRGSVFLIEFCNEVSQHYESKHFTDMLTSIQGKVSGRSIPHDHHTSASQMPEHRSTLTKSMYLHSA